MKRVYPVRHPASLAADTSAAKTSPSHEPSLPHERDEASASQASATPQQKDVGRRAYDNATDGTTDTDKGAEMDKVYNERVAPDRGPAQPRP
jgi:hypothetical protein